MRFLDMNIHPVVGLIFLVLLAPAALTAPVVPTHEPIKPALRGRQPGILDALGQFTHPFSASVYREMHRKTAEFLRRPKSIETLEPREYDMLKEIAGSPWESRMHRKSAKTSLQKIYTQAVTNLERNPDPIPDIGAETSLLNSMTYARRLIEGDFGLDPVSSSTLALMLRAQVARAEKGVTVTSPTLDRAHAEIVAGRKLIRGRPKSDKAKFKEDMKQIDELSRGVEATARARALAQGNPRW